MCVHRQSCPLTLPVHSCHLLVPDMSCHKSSGCAIFNNEELDWIADKCGFADRNTMGGTFKKSLAKRPEATERAINYIFLF